jgi:hypothetical protein
MNAGSSIYCGQFKPLTPQEIRSFLALYILQGLSPSPHIKMKVVPLTIKVAQGRFLKERQALILVVWPFSGQK